MIWRIFRMDVTKFGDYLNVISDNSYKNENR